MSQPDLSISLLSFNTKDLLETCLSSIYKSTQGISFEVLLVDNGSKDGTLQMVEKKFPQVLLTKNRQNKLYIKGHNQNLRKVNGRYFLILNEDTYIGPSILKKMVQFMDKNPKIGLSSCRQTNAQGRLNPTCSRLPIPLVEIFNYSFFGRFLRKTLKIKAVEKLLESYTYKNWARNTIKKVEVVPGSFMMGKTELLEKVGYFDEQNLLFFYGEPDFCKRVKEAGYQIYHFGKINIKHLESKAFSKLPSLKRYQIVEHDMLSYYKKHFGYFWWFLLWLSLRPNWLYWHLNSRKN